jgi:hypothetical protein
VLTSLFSSTQDDILTKLRTNKKTKVKPHSDVLMMAAVLPHIAFIFLRILVFVFC